MFTKEEIGKIANEYALRIFGASMPYTDIKEMLLYFYEKANDQNAAEIAELKAENERLKERLFKYENRDSE